MTAPGSAPPVRRIIAPLIATMLVSLVCSLWPTAAPAHLGGGLTAIADTAPPSGQPSEQTVSADPLPTVQIDGVALAQLVLGNTVYVTGSFAYARPAGTPVTSSSRMARSDLLAYDIRTGTLIAGFDHALNAQGRTIVASPDGKRIYLGGNFTTVDGRPHNRIAAFDTASGALIDSFSAGLNNTVLALAATNQTVYAGGLFSTADGVARARLSAFTAAGVLTSWNPGADASVTALVLAPDQSRIVVGGSFARLGNVTRYGIGAVYPTGLSAPWSAAFPVRDYGLQSAIDTLSVSGRYVYGGGYSFRGDGNFEGRFAVDPNTGTALWINSCQGDTYSVVVLGQVLYSASHEHDCSDIGSFSQDTVSSTTATRHFLAAETLTVGGTIRPPMYNGSTGLAGTAASFDFSGRPHSTQLAWYPSLAPGTTTTARQAAWTVAANSSYLSVGGEFPTADGKPQQGLVRYAISAVAPDKVGPSTPPAPTVTGLPALTAGGTSTWGTTRPSGRLRVSWTAPWDQDNVRLSYAVYRDSEPNPVFRTTNDGTFYQRRSLGFVDANLLPGSLHSYRVEVRDPFGNVAAGPYSRASLVGRTLLPAYPALVGRDGASELWRLDESAGTTGHSTAGFTDLRLGSQVNLGRPGPIDGAGTSASFSGDFRAVTSTGASPVTTYHSASMALAGTVSAPRSTYSLEAWVETTSTRGGTVIADGALPPSGASSYGSDGQVSPVLDRVLYLDTRGRAVFGVRDGNQNTVINSDTAVNDGRWHHVVATTGVHGSTLWVNGTQRASNPGMIDTETFWGAWRVGAEGLFAWPLTPSSGALNGSLADVAVYPRELTGAQIGSHFAAAAAARR